MSLVDAMVFGSVLTVHGATSLLDGLVLLYVGPDQILPLTSAFAALVGVLMMFWNRLVAFFSTRRGRFRARR